MNISVTYFSFLFVIAVLIDFAWQPEIGNFNNTVDCQQNITGCQISMNHLHKSNE